jgi:hypothetical protein
MNNGRMDTSIGERQEATIFGDDADGHIAKAVAAGISRVGVVYTSDGCIKGGSVVTDFVEGKEDEVHVEAGVDDRKTKICAQCTSA